MYVDHFYFVHSSVDGHFHCFQVLAIVNIVGVQDCKPVTFFFNIYIFIYLFIYLFIFGCVGSSFVREGFL